MAKPNILKVARLEALTDGIFAIAMTILVLDLHIPLKMSDENLWSVLTHDTLEKLAIYAGSFIILGTQYVVVYFQFGFLDRVTRGYLWINILCLMFLCIIPFSASLLADYPKNPISISFYAVNLILVTVGRLIGWEYSCIHKLNNLTHAPYAYRSIIRRLLITPVFYIAASFIAYWNMYLAFMLLIAPLLIYVIPGKIDQYLEEDR